MKILLQDKAAVEAALAAMHTGKERERMLDYEDLVEIRDCAEQRASRLLKKHRKGFCYYYTLNSKKPGAYKYRYAADTVTLRWSAKGWVLESLERKMFFPNEKDRSTFYWKLKDDEKEAVEKYVKDSLLARFIKG